MPRIAPREKANRLPNQSRSLRIGVWCYYGATLKATAGIGVFVFNFDRRTVPIAGVHYDDNWLDLASDVARKVAAAVAG